MTSLPLARQPIDWEVIDDGLYDWLFGLLGLPVIWENQNINQPDYPYLSLERGGSVRLGGVPEKRYTTVGVDKEIEATALVEFAVAIHAHVDFATGANDPMNNGPYLLEKVRASLGLVSVQRNFQDNLGLAIVEDMPVQDVSIVVNDEWISRAMFEMRLRTRSVTTETVEAFDKVQLVSPTFGVDTEVDAS